MRLDVYLFESGIARSRTEAKNMIVSGAVLCNGISVTKPSYEIEGENVDISVSKENFEYVSRGGYKLRAALECFNVSPNGMICIDIGASSGGFTDCLLQNGAEYVYAVDSGTMQLVYSLRENKKVCVMENYNARYLKAEDFSHPIDLAVMDVSFISATYIMPALYGILEPGAAFICLVKPQFEVGRAGLSKGGIVKDEKLRISALNKVIDFAKMIGFELVSHITSPIKGGDGNIEFLAYFIKH